MASKQEVMMQSRSEATVTATADSPAPSARPAPFPHRYTVILEHGQLLAGARPPIALGAAPQVGGSDQAWSPEELLVGAVLECLWTTFEAHARHDGLEVHGWRGTGVGMLDKGIGGPTFTSIVLNIDIAVAPSHEQRTRKILQMAEERCIVTKALRIPVTVVAKLHAG
jgi:organic hydroperoxide reductase OsmC/OhrA